MHTSLTNLPTQFDNEYVTIRGIEWGDHIVAAETHHTGFDMTPLLKGLPDDRCPAEHWGVVLKGEMRVSYADHSEIVKAGEVYYLAPGHIVSTDPGTELVEFSPKDAVAQTMEVIAGNLAKMMEGAPQ